MGSQWWSAVALVGLWGCEGPPEPALVQHELEAVTLAISSGGEDELAEIQLTTKLTAVAEAPDQFGPAALVAIERLELVDETGRVVASLEADFEPGFDRFFMAGEDERTATIVNVTTTNGALMRACGQPLRLFVGVTNVSSRGVETAVDHREVLLDCP